MQTNWSQRQSPRRADVRAEAEKLYTPKTIQPTASVRRRGSNVYMEQRSGKHELSQEVCTCKFTVPNLLWASLGRICWKRFPRKRYRHDRSPHPAFGRKILVLIFLDLHKNHIGTESPNSMQIPGMEKSMPWCNQITDLGIMRWVGNATSSTRRWQIFGGTASPP